MSIDNDNKRKRSMRRNEDEKLNNEDEYDEEGELRNLKSLRG